MADSTAQVLRDWRRQAERHAGHAGADQLIEPYVLETNVCGHDLRLLIATAGARTIFDSLALYPDLVLMHQLRMVPAGAVVFDVGAHQGLYATVLARMAGPDGHVYAFEPLPLHADLIRFNARLNALPIEVFELAIGGAGGTARFSPTTLRSDGRGEDAIEVRMETLDRFAHLRPDFVKMDIEGAEIDALGAAAEVLVRRPNLQLEVHAELYPSFGHTAADLHAVLPLAGYVCYFHHPDRPVVPYEPELEICDYCALYFLRDPPRRRQPDAGDPGLPAYLELFHCTKRELSRRIEALHGEVADRNATIAWLHREVAQRDQTITWLHQEVANRDTDVGRLHREVALRDAALVALRRELAASTADELAGRPGDSE